MYLAFLPIILAIIILIITLILSLFLIKRRNYIDISEKSEYASLWLRLIAATIDIILLLILFKFIKFLLPWGFFWEFLISPYYIWFYFAFFQSSNLQATLGMKMLRLKIVDENQEKIGFWRASVCLFSFGIFIIPTLFLLSHRQFQKLIEELPFFDDTTLYLLIVSFVTVIGVLIIHYTKRKQGLHNFISRTLVIKNV